MARVRFTGAEPVTVPELGRTVQPDEMVEVPDNRFEGYVCQPAAWESVEEPRDWVWPTEESDKPDQAEPPAEAAPKTAPKKTSTAAKAATSKEA
ncbi:hypothetical protein [Streptomyces sp. NPDC048438]|uniref:hypothetical protein n=1 Tax=Streptomyces sp. NPDC048438 TaxID=3365551 RepID=UPI0037102242